MVRRSHKHVRDEWLEETKGGASKKKKADFDRLVDNEMTPDAINDFFRGNSEGSVAVPVGQETHRRGGDDTIEAKKR